MTSDLQYTTKVCNSIVILCDQIIRADVLLHVYKMLRNIRGNVEIVFLPEKKQVAQLSQRDRAAGWVSNGQKWKTGTERQYLRTM